MDKGNKKNTPPPMTVEQHLKAATGTLARCAEGATSRDGQRESVRKQLLGLAGELVDLAHALDDGSNAADEVVLEAAGLAQAARHWAYGTIT